MGADVSENFKAVMYSEKQGHDIVKKAWEWSKPPLGGGKRLLITVKHATRSVEQNDRLHAMLHEVAQRMTWAGKKHDLDTWKRLFVAAWLRARGEQVELLPAIDGHGVDIVFRHTSKLSVSECSELMEYITAWVESGGHA